jgi:UDPglucose--hexose-1-phosphate uridylyltransferase
MELRKDPITRSWVVIGHPERVESPADVCPLCPGHEVVQKTFLVRPETGPWQVRVMPHVDPFYRVEGELAREADGIYDRMGLVGAHEIVVETPLHDRRLSQLSDEQIELVLSVYAERIADLKKDRRFKYVTVFKNQGTVAGAEWVHAHSEVTATTFVPRRILYELRAARIWYQEKERCVFCDIVRQEEKLGKRLVDAQGEYLAFCPYASRVPYETWIMHRKHNHLFETPKPGAVRRNLASLLGRTLRRIEQLTQDYHLVVHTSPNTDTYKGELNDYWTTIADDYHWHIEILPIVERRSKSYSIKEVYFNPLAPEVAAEKLRGLAPKG